MVLFVVWIFYFYERGSVVAGGSGLARAYQSTTTSLGFQVFYSTKNGTGYS